MKSYINLSTIDLQTNAFLAHLKTRSKVKEAIVSLGAFHKCIEIRVKIMSDCVDSSSVVVNHSL